MEGIQLSVVPGKPRFKTPSELIEGVGTGRLSEGDVRNRIVKMKSDANVAMAKIDQALECRSRRAPRLERRSREHQEYVSNLVGLEIEYRSGGPILGIR